MSDLLAPRSTKKAAKPVGYKFRGVPKVFADRTHAMMFLRNSPGYVQRNAGYLKTYWPGLADELGLNQHHGLVSSVTSHLEHGLGETRSQLQTAAHVANTVLPAIAGLPPDYTVSNLTHHPIRTYQRQAKKQKQLEKRMGAALKAGDQKRISALIREGAQYESILGPLGGGGKAAKALAAKAAEEVVPAHIAAVREAVPGAREVRVAQEQGYTIERAKRATSYEEELLKDPTLAGHEAAKAHLRGELPKLGYRGFDHLTPDAMNALIHDVAYHPQLLPFQKTRLIEALKKTTSGTTPTHSELDLIEHVFGPKVAQNLADPKNLTWGDKAINVINIPRSLQSTLDVSGLTRQAFVAMTTHPIIWGKAAPAYIKAFRLKNYRLIDEAVKNDPNYHLAIGHVSFSDPFGPLLAHEEAYASDYATKIPVLGRAIKGSAQGYTAFLNKIRMDMFSHFVRLERKAFEMSGDAGRNPQREEFLKSVGDIVNAATGRGAIHGRLEHMMPAANTLLYSPRLMLSRLNYFDPTWYVRLHSKRARIEALKGLFATTAYVTGVVTLLSQVPGVSVGSLDPLSSDFGKLRQGDTRVDVAAGFLQYVHLAAVLEANAKISTTTGKKMKFGTGFGQQNRWDQVQNFFINKAAPPVALAIGLGRGHDPVGDPMSLNSVGAARHVAGNLFFPLSIQDAKDLYKQRKGGLDGITAASAGYGLSAVGLGVQTYLPKKKKPRKSSSSGGLLSPRSAGTGGNLLSPRG